MEMGAFLTQRLKNGILLNGEKKDEKVTSF